MRVATESLFKALDQFQDAALEPTRWRAIMEAVSLACGAMGANVMQPKGDGALGGVLFTESLDRVMEDYVREEWYLRDYRARFIPLLQDRGVILERDMATAEQMKTMDYYKFLAKHRLQNTAIMDISPAHSELYFVLQRDIDEGPFDPEDVVHFHSLRSHFIAAAQLMRHFANARNNGMATAFETAHIGCVFFDRKGRVLLANPKAESLLRTGPYLSQGMIKAAYPAENAALQNILSAVTGQGRSLDKIQRDFVLLSRFEGRPLIARFQKLGEQFSDIFNPAVAMALIEDPDEDIDHNPEKLAALFGLTPAETRISLLLATGTSAVDIALQTGLSYETVRSHISSIFRKTETGRQSELSALFSKIRL
jgi:DNA-binding CsgD family transcriptional regulator/PAS domain-containing protein